MLVIQTLATGALAALSVSALLAQQNNPIAGPHAYYQYEQGAKPAAPPRALTLPPVAHICFAGCASGGGMTLFLENGRFVAKDGRGIAAAYEVVKFTADSVIITRTDYRPRPANATLTGRISTDGNALVDGKAQWSKTVLNPFQMAWGDAIDTVPGNVNEKPAIAPCEASASVEQAFQYAVQALGRNKTDLGMCWMRRSVDQGYPRAQSSLAVILYRGMYGVPKDSHTAFDLAQKSAASGDPLGDQTLSQMYASGDGAPKDEAKADYWRARSEQDKSRPKPTAGGPPANGQALTFSIGADGTPQLGYGPPGANANNMASMLGQLMASAIEESGSLPDRISSLEGAIEDAARQCRAARPVEGSCDRVANLRADLSRAQSALHAEIGQLQQAHQKLDSLCKAGNQDACENLTKVDEQLRKDQTSIF